jgi:DNA-binding transcriptional regulator YiaG
MWYNIIKECTDLNVPTHMDVRTIRAELGLSQSELAAMAGMSVRAVQSYEQGWRCPSDMVRRVLLLLLIGQRNGDKLTSIRCWEQKNCLPEIRNRCIAYVTRQGHICWFFTGTLCEGKRKASWSDKISACMECSVMQILLHPPEQQG